jgi:DNA processing protein
MEKTDVERLGRPACAVRDALDSSRDRSLVVDELVEITGLGVDAVLEALLTLTLAAVVVEGPAGFYRRIAPIESD